VFPAMRTDDSLMLVAEHLTRLTAYAYNTLMRTFISMLFDGEKCPLIIGAHDPYLRLLESSSQNLLNTILRLLVQSRKQGSVDSVNVSSRRYAGAISHVSEIRISDCSEEDKQELVHHAIGGFRVAMHLLHSLISFSINLEIWVWLPCRNPILTFMSLSISS